MLAINPRTRRCPRLLAWTIGLSLALAAPATLRADNLDVELMKYPNLILSKLDKQDIKNFGVLHFSVKKAHKQPSFNLGTLSETLAYRLENALIVYNTGDELGIIRNASAVAAKNKIGAWSQKEAERKKLFDLAYPQAWGDKKVKADAFLTGVVEVAEDLGTARVIIEVFSAKHLKPAKLTEFTVRTDRSLLADLGQTFVVAQRGLSPLKRDAAAVADARKREKKEVTNDAATPEDTYGFKVRILYDGQEQQIMPDSNAPGTYRVQPPQPNQKVAVELTNTGKYDRTLAAVLKVNGKSTYKQQDMESLQCQMWLQKPGEVQTYQGYYDDLSGQFFPFQVLDAEESEKRASEFGGKAGLITAEVFDSQPKDKEPPDQLQISLRGLSQRTAREKPAKSLNELRHLLLAKGNMKLPSSDKVVRKGGEGGLMVAAPDKLESVPIGVKEFPNPVHRATLTIRYYDPNKTTLSPLQVSDK